MPKKVNMISSKSVFIKYVAKILLLSVISIIILSSLFSVVLLKFDLNLDFAVYMSIIIVGISAITVSYFSVSSFSNNGAVWGIFSVESTNGTS